MRREGYAPVVDAIRVRGARRSAQGEVPLEEVFVERGGMVVFCWVFGEFVGFPDCRLSAKLGGEVGGRGRGRTDPLDCGRLCVECLGHSSFLSTLVFFVCLGVIVPFRCVSFS